MMADFRSIFCPTLEDNLEHYANYVRIYKEQEKEHGCTTCKHCIHVINYPGFVTGEECICDVGLECDTVLYTVKNCKQWEGDMITWDEWLGG